MKSIRIFSLSIFIATLCVLVAPLAFAQEEEFSIPQYNAFHEVLRPLQHEAVPARDFQRIRLNSAKLVQRGRAIVRLGIPRDVARDKRQEFQKELRKFSTALSKLSRDAGSGTDAQLETSFGAVHDSFETVAGMLPRK